MPGYEAYPVPDPQNQQQIGAFGCDDYGQPWPDQFNSNGSQVETAESA